MFWKIIELLVRIIYWRRFRTATKIGEAAKLLSDGKPEAALAHLEKNGNAVHQTLLPLFALTQGKIHEALGRLDEAEASLKTVVLMNPKDARADVELAVLVGRQGRFDECRTWLTRALEKEECDSTVHAKEILAHLDAIERGDILLEYEARAQALAEKPLLDGRAPGLNPDMALLETWIGTPEAKESIDDVALLLAYAEVQKGGKWQIGLSIEETTVIKADGSAFRPFDTVGKWMHPKAISASSPAESK
ncbi:MAG: hypothetical protein JXX14_25455 [Deltaproteobacteria bacterium]|nr:hypothetical protein [Deltaproteobacteria bacterium]